MNKNFTKILSYNRYDHTTLVETYINIDCIESLSKIRDDEEVWYMLYCTNSSYRISKEGYDYLANLLYGKEPENA